jgi:oligoribonuclease
MGSAPTNLLWIDLETTGLNTSEDHVLEIACFVTDANGDNPRHHREWIISPEAPDWSERMIDFVADMHANSGLLEEIHETGEDENEVRLEFTNYLANRFNENNNEKLTVAGSGIGPFDRIILKEQFPELEQYLNYYVMDVGVIGRFLRHCCGMEEEWGERQEVNHRAMNDIHDHYAEFQFYQNWVKR